MVYNSDEEIKRHIKEMKAELKSRNLPLKKRIVNSFKSLGTIIKIKWKSYLSKQMNITQLKTTRDELQEKLIGEPVKSVFTRYFKPGLYIKLSEAKNAFMENSLKTIKQARNLPSPPPSKFSITEAIESHSYQAVENEEIEEDSDEQDEKFQPKRRPVKSSKK